MKNEEWTSVEDGLPSNGVYMTRITSLDGEQFEARRKLKGGNWLGGCRPFTDGEKITHYREISVIDEMFFWQNIKHQ